MDVQLHQNFCRKLNEALAAKGWTKSDLAREMGLTRQMVTKYCQGETCPGLDLVERFAKALDLEPWSLVDERPLEYPHLIG